MRHIIILILLLATTSLAASLFPRFTFTPTAPMPGAAVSFDASSSICTASPCTYRWTDDADNSSLGVGRLISFTFKQAGTKYVRLTIMDARGKTASGQADVVVSDVPPPPPPPPPPSGVPTTFYLSSSGNDSAAGTSLLTPWKTIAKLQGMLPALHPGDSVLFKCGEVWNEQFNLNNIHGAAGNPITIGHYGSNCELPNRTYLAVLPVLNGGSVRQHGFYSSGGISYLTIDGFDVHDTTMGGIEIETGVPEPGITIQNNLVHRVGAGACAGCGTPHDDGSYNAGLGFRDFSGGSGQDGVQILNNTVWDVGGHNTLGVHYDTSANLRVMGNLVGPGCLHNCIDTKGVSGVISNNITTCSSGRGDQCSSGDAGFYIENTYAPAASVTYRNNVAYSIAIGFQASAGGTCASKSGGNCSITAKYYNNTVYKASAYTVYFGTLRGIDSLDIRNNIFNGASMRMAGAATSTTENYNDCYGGASCSGSSDLSIDPQYVSPGSDFHLQPTSPVIGKGTDVGLGGILDLGAFPH